MKQSKTEIDKLGNVIRNEPFPLSESTIDKLQEYRTSHQLPLSTIFTVLCSYIRKIHPTSIVTYRIKRFESIIGKLSRFPEMRFSRMWDIGGCRFIVRNDQDVYKVKSLIQNDDRIEIVKEKDYILNPQEDGYKSLHLFVKSTQDDRIIEIQIRSLKDHNWATLVEITDLLYDTKVKELGNNPDLVKFHLLLSRLTELNIHEKKEVSMYLERFNYFEKLSEVFTRNYIKVRQQWFDIQNLKNHRYFLIETKKDEPPRIYSFKNSKEAEKEYLNLYKRGQNINIVLIHLPNPSYHQLSIAYSNYILTFHSFLDECYELLESLIVEALETGKYYDFFRIYKLYNSLLFEHISNLVAEIGEINSLSTRSNGKKNNTQNTKEKEWIKDINKQVYRSRERSNRLAKKYKTSMPTSFVGKFIVTRMESFVIWKFKRKISKIIPKPT